MADTIKRPKDGARALLVWYGGQATPIVASWERDRWLHSGPCQSAPDMVIPIQMAVRARDMLAALKGVVRVADRDTVEFDAARDVIAGAETT